MIQPEGKPHERNLPFKSWGRAVLLLILSSTGALFGAETSTGERTINPFEQSGQTLQFLEQKSPTRSAPRRIGRGESVLPT